MEDYEPAFCSTLATALACSEKPQLWEGTFAVREHSQYMGKSVDLHREGKQNALREPGTPICSGPIVDLLHSRYKKPNQPAPATAHKADHFQADIFWIRTD